MRILYHVPIVHGRAEAVKTASPSLDNENLGDVVRRIQSLIEAHVLALPLQWTETSLYADGIYEERQIETIMANVLPPDCWSSHLLYKLACRGARIEVTEQKDLCARFATLLKTSLPGPDRDRVKRERDAVIAKRINQTLRKTGVLLLGFAHEGPAPYLDHDIETQRVLSAAAVNPLLKQNRRGRE